MRARVRVLSVFSRPTKTQGLTRYEVTASVVQPNDAVRNNVVVASTLNGWYASLAERSIGGYADLHWTETPYGPALTHLSREVDE